MKFINLFIGITLLVSPLSYLQGQIDHAPLTESHINSAEEYFEKKLKKTANLI